MLICPGKIRGQQLSTLSEAAAMCLWELLELLLSLSLWQLCWLDKYKLWEFNSHHRLVLGRNLHTHTHTHNCLCLWQRCFFFKFFTFSRNLICLPRHRDVVVIASYDFLLYFAFCCFLFDALSKVRDSFISFPLRRDWNSRWTFFYRRRTEIHKETERDEER